MKTLRWDAFNFIENRFINKLNLLHVEVYQNEISRRLPTVLFCVIFLLLSFLPWLKTFLRIEVRYEIKLRIAQVCTFLCLKFLISADETKTRKSCSRFEIKWQSTWFRHGFLNRLIWFSLERLHSLKKIKINKNGKKKTGTKSYS